MTTLRARFNGWIDSRIEAGGRVLIDRAEMEHWRESFLEAYRLGPYMLSPERLVEQLQEYGDSAMIADLVRQIGWEQLGATGGDREADRLRAVDEARRLNRIDCVTEYCARTWTNYGMGERVVITPVDEDARADWNEFWNADRNRSVLSLRKLHEMSGHDVLLGGELFLACYVSTLDGEVTVRRIDTKEITAIVTDPGDAGKPLFYKRIWTPENGSQEEMYYPDWLAGLKEDGRFDIPTSHKDTATGLETNILPRGAKRADEQDDGLTFKCILHAAHNVKDKSGRGWPMTVTSAPWTREHKQFRESRAAVAAHIAMFVSKIKAKSGTRGIAAIRAKLQSALSATNYSETNPPGVAGSTWLENEAAELTRLSQSTGAGDAKTDGEALLQMAGLGWGIYPHWLGAGDAYRLATATSMEGPLLRNFSRYQLFWSSIWEDLVRLVLMMRERYNGAHYETYKADVSTDRLLEVDLPALVEATGELYKEILLPLFETGQLPTEVLNGMTEFILRQVLQALGAADPAEVVSDEAFEQEEPEAEPVNVAEGGADAIARIARAIGANMANGNVELGTALEWAIGEGVAAVREEMGDANNH